MSHFIVAVFMSEDHQRLSPTATLEKEGRHETR